MWSFKGAAVVVLLAGVLAIPLYKYWAYLTAGMRPPAATLKMNQLEHGVPDFEVVDLNGKTIRFSEFRGKVLLVNIWATWCAPCVKEFPALRNLVREMKGDLTILAISYDRHREDIDSFIKVFGGLPENFLVAWDRERKTTEIFGTDVLPETYLISREGKLLRKIAGEAAWDEPMALEYFRNIIDGKTPGKPEIPEVKN